MAPCPWSAFRRHRRLGVTLAVAALLLAIALIAPAHRASLGPAIQLGLSKLVSPDSVGPGSLVTYRIMVTNPSALHVDGLVLTDTLPLGFDYVRGSSRISVNGVTISASEPSVESRTLIWSDLTLPPARQDSFYGIHTFVQRRTDSDHLNYQLDRARDLMGQGAFVTQLFDWIETSWAGPQDWMRDFVARAYDRDLNPIIRLAGGKGTEFWYKPKPGADGHYTAWVQAFRRVVEQLPRRDGHRLYIQIWNEPNLHEEWEGQADAQQYGRFLVEMASALRSIGDPRIVIVNAPLSPGAGDPIGIYYLQYLDDMLDVPGATWAFDVWGSHPYPNNHPPEYNLHNGTATYGDATIDLYRRELEVLARHGRSGLQVLLTETGYALGQAHFSFEGFAPIAEANRADYIERALRDYWGRWPEVIGVCPYELVDPLGDWAVWDWLYPDGRSHQQYDAVRAMGKEVDPVTSTVEITFQATASSALGTHYNRTWVSAPGAAAQSTGDTAPVAVVAPTPTATATRTRTSTASPTPTLSATASPSAQATRTPTGTLPTPSGSPTCTPSPTSTPECRDALVNGGFETDDGWQISSTDHPAGYHTGVVRSGRRSMRVGIDIGDNVRSYSSVWQEIALPADAPDPELGFWYRADSTDTAGDRFYVRLEDTNGAVLESVPELRINVTDWTYRELSLADYRGTIIRVRLGAYNDGGDGVTAIYVDDASVTTCGIMPGPTPTTTLGPSPSVTHSPTWPSPTRSQTATATASPSPTQPPPPECSELILDGSFELGSEAWSIPDTGYPGAYVTAVTHSGQRAVRLGIVSTEDNVYSFSSVAQTVHIPAGMGLTTLTFWYYPLSGTDANDLQYVLIQDAQGTSDWVFRQRSDSQAWALWSHILPPAFYGQDVTLRFGVVNDGEGTVTAMYVDDVSLVACRGGAGTHGVLFLPVVIRQASPVEATQLPASTGSGRVGTAAARWRSLASLEMVGSDDAPRRVAMDLLRNRLLVSRGRHLWCFDADTGAECGQTELPASIWALTIYQRSRFAYASLRDQDTVAVLEAETLRLHALVSGISKPSGLATSAERLYVTATGSDELVALDLGSHAIIRRIAVGDAPYAVALSGEGHEAYVANAGTDTISIVDTSAAVQVGTVALGGMGHPQNLALDNLRHRLYVSYALSANRTALAGIDLQSAQVTSRLLQVAGRPLVSAYDLQVDPLNGQLYVLDWDRIIVLEGNRLSVQEVWPVAAQSGPLTFCLDPVRRRLYVQGLQAGPSSVLWTELRSR